MNNTVLKIVAALLAVGAIVVALIGVRLSQQPPAPVVAPPPIVQTASAVEVAVATRPIRLGQTLTAADVTLKSMQDPPPQAYRQTQDLAGRVASADIPAGTPLEPAHFVSDSLAIALRPGERAIAVQVDEVIGLGGFARPGDHVDVLAYMAANRETNSQSFAQVTVSDARILAFGEVTQMDADLQRQTLAQDSKDPPVDPVKKQQEIQERRRALRSAVLAIPESEASRLMLAAGSGTLRLALRPRLIGRTASATDTLSAVATPAQGPSRTISLHSMAPPSLPNASDLLQDPGRRENAVIIQEGNKERRLATADSPTQ
jgi:pilus assembly protein CpaB